MIRAVLSDMDGTLFDSEYFYMSGTVDQMRQYGYTGEEKEIYRILGTDMEGTYRILHELLEGKVPYETIVKNNEYYFGTLHPIDYRAIMFKDVPKGLKKLKEDGLKLAVCSSSPKETIQESLQAMGILEYFDYIVSSDEVDRPKPAPDVYLKACEMLGVKKEECIVYEDAAMGIEAGKNAGMTTIARRDDRFGQDQSRADSIVNDMTAFVQYVEKENGYR